MLFVLAYVEAMLNGVTVALPVLPLVASAGIWVYSRFYSKRDEYIHQVSFWLAVTVLFCTSFALATDAVALNCDLKDHLFVKADRFLCLDATDIVAWVQEHRLLHKACFAAYFSMVPQLILALLITNRALLVKRMMVAAVITLLCFNYMPALGNYANTDAECHNQPIKERMLALSHGQVDTIRIGDCEGIICAPSYHTIMGCLLIMAFSQVAAVRWWAVGLNGLMIYSTVPTGGHYIVDVLAGLLVAGLVAAVVRR